MLTKDRANFVCGQAEAFNASNNEHRQFMTADEIRHVETLSPHFAFCDHVQHIAGRVVFGRNGSVSKPWTV